MNMLSLRQLATPLPPSPFASSPVMICLLGAFSLLHYGAPMPVRSGGKTEALLVMLALRCRRPTPRDALLAEVWPDAEPGLARQALNSLLHGLRRQLSPALQGESPVV